MLENLYNAENLSPGSVWSMSVIMSLAIWLASSQYGDANSKCPAKIVSKSSS
jgi:hypothetical protein